MHSNTIKKAIESLTEEYEASRYISVLSPNLISPLLVRSMTNGVIGNIPDFVSRWGKLIRAQRALNQSDLENHLTYLITIYQGYPQVEKRIEKLYGHGHGHGESPFLNQHFHCECKPRVHVRRHANAEDGITNYFLSNRIVIINRIIPPV